MGLAALLPLGRKSCYGFLLPLKIHCPRPGLNPRTLGPMTIMLPLDHQGQLDLCSLDIFHSYWCPEAPLSFMAHNLETPCTEQKDKIRE
jgi:hypothetical protein